ncbi:MAG: hypothetical protein IPI88_10855 [Chitinophagaceae bacterium]|nr:hypothetical protein [Chitinophagaceae bacterium]
MNKRHIIGPVHFASSTGNLQVTITDSITMRLQQVWAEMCAQIPTDAVSATGTIPTSVYERYCKYHDTMQ